MVEGSKGAPPTGNTGRFSGFKGYFKTTTFRVILPIVVSVHLAWYFMRDRMVYDEKLNAYVDKYDRKTS